MCGKAPLFLRHPKDNSGCAANGERAAQPLISIQEPAGKAELFRTSGRRRRDADGRVTQTTEYGRMDFGYDSVGDLRYTGIYNGSYSLSELAQYDKLGRILQQTDTAGIVTDFVYNDIARTRKTVRVKPNDSSGNEETLLAYDARGDLLQVTDAKQQVYVFNRDALGRVISQTRADATMSFEYDANGNRTRRTDYIGRLTKYTYDKLNRLEKTEYGEDGDLQLPVTYTYDEISQLKTATNENGTVSFNYDNRNRLLNTTDVFGHTVGYNHVYSSTVNRLELILDGSVHAQYNFDDAGRLTNIVSPADSTTIGFTYDNANRPETRTFPNGVTTTYTFDRMSRLTRLTDTSQTATLFDRQYEYNNANQIESVTEPGKVRNFSYDFVNRLTGMTSPTEPAESYNFDKVGNRTASHRSANYGYETGQFNRVNSTDTAGYVYDQNGNIRMKAEGKELWRYQWDFDNRLVSASTRKQTVRYKYDALGRRIQRFIVGGKENTKFIYDGADVIADDNSGTLTKYLNGPGIDNKLRMQTGSDVRYFIADHLGSTNALTDSSGNVTSSAAYDSFGNATDNLATRYKFTGREYDDFTGLHYYRARWYDGNLGRFISEDPIGFAGGDVNLYGYVGNDTLAFRDPSGEIPLLVPIIIGAGVLILSSPSYVNAPGECDPRYDSRDNLVANGVVGLVGGYVIGRFVGPMLGRLMFGPGDEIIELGIAGGPRGSLPGPTVDPRTGQIVGRFVVDESGNTMIEPVGGSTVATGRGGVDTHTLYPNGSNYQRLNPLGHQNNPVPHGHGHLPGTGPGMRGQGQSIDSLGNVVDWNSPDAHWWIISRSME